MDRRLFLKGTGAAALAAMLPPAAEAGVFEVTGKIDCYFDVPTGNTLLNPAFVAQEMLESLKMQINLTNIMRAADRLDAPAVRIDRVRTPAIACDSVDHDGALLRPQCETKRQRYRQLLPRHQQRWS